MNYQSKFYKLEAAERSQSMILFYLGQATTPEQKKEWQAKKEANDKELEELYSKISNPSIV